MGKVDPGWAVEREKVSPFVLAENPCLQMGMDGKLIAPVPNQSFLGDDDGGVDYVVAQPVKHEIHTDLRLAEPLFVKDGGEGKILHRLECLDLIHEAQMLGGQVGF